MINFPKCANLIPLHVILNETSIAFLEISDNETIPIVQYPNKIFDKITSLRVSLSQHKNIIGQQLDIYLINEDL